MLKGYSAAAIFTGEHWLADHTIVVNEGAIFKVVPSRETENLETLHFDDALIVPAFIDIQVYGSSKKLLAVHPKVETLQLMYDEFSAKGTVLCLPTVATNTIETFKKCIDAVREYWKTGGRGIWGLHLEGPWLNESKRGAHVKEWIHSPTMTEVKDLLEYSEGVVKMITIAPEVCSAEIIEYILSQNIVLSAGHSNATYEEAMQSFDNGITTVTHMYNAMSALQHRSPGLVGAAFNHTRVMSSVIPDGYHVDYAAIKIAKKMMGERLFAITDAVSETNIGPYQHQLIGDKYECNGVLSGSALSMYQAFLNLVLRADINIEEALRMCSTYPAMVLGCNDRYGRIVPQAAGQFLVLNKQLELLQVITGHRTDN